MTYKQFDVVLVPFPFTDKEVKKRRPALVVSKEKSFNNTSEHCVLAMITSTKKTVWPMDVHLSEPKRAGLPKQCLVRMKIFTISSPLIIRKLGTLSTNDKAQVKKMLSRLI